MKRTSSELKSIAKGRLLGNYSVPIGAMVIVIAATFFITLLTTFSILKSFTTSGIIVTYIIELIISILLSVLMAGMSSLYLNLCRGREYKVGNILYAFRNYPDHAIGIIVLLILIGIACFLPAILLALLSASADRNVVTLLLILFEISGIILAVILLLSYSQAIYIYIDAPEKKVLEVLRESKKMMRGNKGRLFYLMVSFIGLMLLSVLTCYIGLLWVGPYFQTTLSLFYIDLKGELD